MNWYYAEGTQQVGPLTEENFDRLVHAGKITAATLVWRDGMAQWRPYGEVRGGGAGAAAATGGVICSACGKSFPAEEVIRFGEQWVCASCKPAYVQRLREGVALPTVLQYAGFGIRFGAKILDGLILGFVFFVVLVVPFMFLTGINEPTPDPGARMIAFQLLINLGYYMMWGAYAIFFTGKYGATPGKMACKLRVVTPEGKPITYGRATGRFFAEILSGMICYIGYIMAAFDDERRSLHDRICDTRVIRSQ